MAEFTPTQKRMMAVLTDGMAHSHKELHACLTDDLAGPTAVRFHISNMRKILRPHGYDLHCCENGETTWRMVRLMASPYDGRR